MDERRGALEYDFRSRFQFPLERVGVDMGWGEATRLVRILRADPGSMLAASEEGWAYPFPRAEAIAADHFDLAYKAAGAKNPQPYPRPFKPAGGKTKRGDAGARTPAEVKALLGAEFGRNQPPI